MSLHEPRLFRLATEAIVLNCVHIPGEGWRMRFVARRGDEGWSDAAPAEYSHLTTPELLDVIDMELGRGLGIV